MSHWKTSRMPALGAVCALCVACLMLASAANAAADLSTPKKAALAFATAVEAGDMDGAKAASIGTDDDYKTLKSLSEMLGSMKRFQAAAVKKYGDEAKAFPDLSAVMSKQIDGAEEKIEGDSATLVIKDKPDDKHPPTLKKTGDEWKMDLKTMSSDPEFAKMKDLAGKATAAINEVTKDIESGKYGTFQEAIQAFAGTMSKLGPEK